MRAIASMTRAIAVLLALAAAAPATAQEAPLTIAQARASLAGEWQAELQYRDYQSDEWIGIPYRASVAIVEDGVTQIRTNAYDDGPARGTVWITSLAMLAADGVTEHTTAFRADRDPSPITWTLALASAADATHWTLVATSQSTDANRPATLRETTVRDGDTVTTTKEVDFSDDTVVDWLMRNRTVLHKSGA